MAALFLSQHLRPARVFIPSPTWSNHRTIWAMAEVQVHDYPYYAPETQAVNLAGMLAVLENTAEAHHVVILQACAHNPTGVDLSQTQWARMMDVVKRKKLFVVFDIAYQGFATGDIDGDAWAVRYFVEELILNGPPEHPGLCVAQSFSKNFGLYGERGRSSSCRTPASLGAGRPLETNRPRPRRVFQSTAIRGQSSGDGLRGCNTAGAMAAGLGDYELKD
jgi:aspartate/tyrosine/aromatic aminotransferase